MVISLERFHQNADSLARRMFKDKNSLPFTFLFISKTGQHHLASLSFATATEKRIAFLGLADLIHLTGSPMYSVLTETWYCNVPSAVKNRVAPSQNPDVKEGVLISTHSAFTGSISSNYDIIRKPTTHLKSLFSNKDIVKYVNFFTLPSPRLMTSIPEWCTQ